MTLKGAFVRRTFEKFREIFRVNLRKNLSLYISSVILGILCLGYCLVSSKHSIFNEHAKMNF